MSCFCLHWTRNYESTAFRVPIASLIDSNDDKWIYIRAPDNRSIDQNPRSPCLLYETQIKQKCKSPHLNTDSAVDLTVSRDPSWLEPHHQPCTLLVKKWAPQAWPWHGLSYSPTGWKSSCPCVHVNIKYHAIYSNGAARSGAIISVSDRRYALILSVGWPLALNKRLFCALNCIVYLLLATVTWSRSCRLPKKESSRQI